jgi:transposase-like protein
MELQEILNKLESWEKKELLSLLKKDIGEIPDLDKVVSKINTDNKVLCPHCHADNITGHGTYKGRKRYKCKQCNKTFNDFTGTAVSGIKKVEKFQEYIELTLESISIRKAAKKLGVNTRTIFDWRHKLLSSLATMNGEAFSGIVEFDDKQLNINEKGSKKLERNAYKRPSDRNTKRGVSNDKVSVMVATDRDGHPMMRIAKVGRIDLNSIEKTIGDFIIPSNVLCSDSHPSLISWASSKNLEHHTFVASRQHIKTKCYHVQHVNSLDNLYERWIKPFYGVATKYLAQYLNWFVFLQKNKGVVNPVKELANAIMSNTNAIKDYRDIEMEYAKLDIPHYSTT